MSRIAACFSNIADKKGKALIPYVTAGDPNPELTVPLMHEMVAAGADIIELGVPFSDPMADGPVIQKASERALMHHVSMLDVLEMVKQFRVDNNETPVVLMGYLNPIEVLGYENFAQKAQAAGVDGVLTVDIPPEEAGDYVATLKAHELDPIFLMSPTTKAERVKKIAKFASGFIYYVSIKGVTGAALIDTAEVEAKVAAIKDATDVPVGVGFGIKDAESAATVSKVSDAVVVGSALVKLIEKQVDKPAQIKQDISELLTSMRNAIDAA